MLPPSPRARSATILAGAFFASNALGDCLLLPPGGACHTGLHEVYKAQSFANTPSLEDVVWLDDGRVAAGFSRPSTFYPKGGVIRIFQRVTTDVVVSDSDNHIEPPEEAYAVNCQFGLRIAASGDLLATQFLKAPHRSGAVGIYEANELGGFELRQILEAPNPAEGDGFGVELAMAGDWLAVADDGDGADGGIRMFKRGEAGAA